MNNIFESSVIKLSQQSRHKLVYIWILGVIVTTCLYTSVSLIILHITSHLWIRFRYTDKTYFYMILCTCINVYAEEKCIIVGRARRGDNPNQWSKQFNFYIYALAVLFYFISFVAQINSRPILRHCNWSASVGNDNRHLITHRPDIILLLYILFRSPGNEIFAIFTISMARRYNYNCNIYNIPYSGWPFGCGGGVFVRLVPVRFARGPSVLPGLSHCPLLLFGVRGIICATIIKIIIIFIATTTTTTHSIIYFMIRYWASKNGAKSHLFLNFIIYYCILFGLRIITTFGYAPCLRIVYTLLLLILP